MKYIEPMNCSEFAAYLLTLKSGDEIYFGCDLEHDSEDSEVIPENVGCWYFARVMEIKEFGSRFILLDYAGGEEAFAIPLNGYKNCCDEDDAHIVPSFVKRYWEYNYNIHDVVYVEMEDE